jgi:hypothetical protein
MTLLKIKYRLHPIDECASLRTELLLGCGVIIS